MNRLHLGCGNRKLDGWINVDVRDEVAPDIVATVRNLDPIDTDSVDTIYACHILEHVPRPELMETLREWRRVLKPGGTLRLSVPDFWTIAELYIAFQTPMWLLIGALYGRQDHEWNTHYQCFDFHYLSWMLTEAGFIDIRYWRPEDVHPEGWDDYSLATIDGQRISLNLEATAK